MSAASTRAASDGDLTTTSVPQLLIDAWRDRRTGCLEMTRDGGQCMVQFEEGRLVSLDAEPTQDGFAASLEEAQLITPTQRSKVEQFASSRECTEARAVLALELLDAKALYQALRTAKRNEIGALLAWQDGRYAWTAAPSDSTSKAKPFDVLKIVQQQLARHWDMDRFFERLMPHSETIFELRPQLRRVSAQLATTSTAARQMIEGFDGETSLGSLLGRAAGDPLAAATLWVLVTAGLLRRREERAEPTDAAFEFEVLLDDPAAGTPATPESTETAPAQTPNPSASPSPKSTALRDEISTMLGRLSELDHYAALGLEVDANAAQIKKAYFKAAKKYHPDVLAQADLDDVRDEAALVFARIAEAFEVLSNAEKRASYDAGDEEATEIDTARLTQAEASYRKGEILIKMGNFAGALEYLEPAVELWPDEPAYQAGLAWALLRQPKSDPSRAAEHFRIAQAQAPGDAMIAYRLGLALRSLGETEESEDCILRARAIDPDVGH